MFCELCGSQADYRGKDWIVRIRVRKLFLEVTGRLFTRVFECSPQNSRWLPHIWCRRVPVPLH